MCIRDRPSLACPDTDLPTSFNDTNKLVSYEAGLPTLHLIFTCSSTSLPILHQIFTCLSTSVPILHQLIIGSFDNSHTSMPNLKLNASSIPICISDNGQYFIVLMLAKRMAAFCERDAVSVPNSIDNRLQRVQVSATPMPRNIINDDVADLSDLVPVGRRLQCLIVAALRRPGCRSAEPYMTLRMLVELLEGWITLPGLKLCSEWVNCPLFRVS